MSQHNTGPKEMVPFMERHGLSYDQPSMCSDAFRFGWEAHKEHAEKSSKLSAIADEAFNACLWLRSTLKCEHFVWDPDQREMAEAALADMDVRVESILNPEPEEKSDDTTSPIA